MARLWIREGFTDFHVGWLLAGLARHNALNDIIHRALSNAGVPSVLEPRGLTSSDERRPDGLTMIPWSEGRCLAWDATVSDSLADSHLNRIVHVAGAAAELAADAKIRKYADLSRAFVLCRLLSRPWAQWNLSLSWAAGSQMYLAIRVIPHFCFKGFL